MFCKLSKPLRLNFQGIFFREFKPTGKCNSDELVVHRDTPENNECTPFEFSKANMTRIEALIKNYPIGYQRSAMGSALDLVQRQIGWVPISAMNKVAEVLKIPRIRVYEYATFYTMYKRQYRGKFHVKVCVTTPCMVRGSDIILQAVQEAACCRVGDISVDGLFGVDTVQCQGCCANAPMIAIDDDYYEDLTVYNVQSIINCLRNGGIPPPGPQSGRYCCEPICGLTSLQEPPPYPGYCMQPALCPPCPPCSPPGKGDKKK